ncbi:MAG: GNAT family N-acetyltransferase [Legionellales bacterium]|nr:GNAT family N-acetyltransferase [Legionellales bacterium]
MDIKTERLLLRRWDIADYQVMIEINGDPEVMRYFPALQNKVETIQLIEKIERHFEKYGFGLYAVQPFGVEHCIGFVGLNYTDFKAHFTPAFEIGWRLSKKYWGRGYATEAAKEILKRAFTDFELEKVVSFTSEINVPSIKVMERIGLKRDIDGDFINPNLPSVHKLAPHVLYLLTNHDYINHLE